MGDNRELYLTVSTMDLHDDAATMGTGHGVMPSSWHVAAGKRPAREGWCGGSPE
jgi:hypothetical protein